ncbi:MAG: hypothetical protein IKI16_05810, partial [Prevotella sp.]|nr:hypothetical protein [Prevotella sp.]
LLEIVVILSNLLRVAHSRCYPESSYAGALHHPFLNVTKIQKVSEFTKQMRIFFNKIHTLCGYNLAEGKQACLRP